MEGNNEKFFQKILFGSPGTGKSYKVHNEIAKELGLTYKTNEGKLKQDSSNVFPTIFHPEYRYGDFIGKLLPHSNKGNIEYRYYLGIFLKALAKAYRNIIDGNEEKNVLLIIDEINRGNTASIFGDVFQLLDRNEDGWSSYAIKLSDLEYEELLKEIGFKEAGSEIVEEKEIKKYKITISNNGKAEEKKLEDLELYTNYGVLKENQIKIPPNLSIVATMNTSDESIFYMDSAFKRRWDWEYIPVMKLENEEILEELDDWEKFRTNLNQFILNNSDYVPKVEDKLIGEHFLKTEKIEDEEGNKKLKVLNIDDIKYKLMFFLWDSVFSRDKTPLENLLKEDDKEIKLRTFGDFTVKAQTFVNKIMRYKQNEN